MKYYQIMPSIILFFSTSIYLDAAEEKKDPSTATKMLTTLATFFITPDQFKEILVDSDKISENSNPPFLKLNIDEIYNDPLNKKEFHPKSKLSKQPQHFFIHNYPKQKRQKSKNTPIPGSGKLSKVVKKIDDPTPPPKENVFLVSDWSLDNNNKLKVETYSDKNKEKATKQKSLFADYSCFRNKRLLE